MGPDPLPTQGTESLAQPTEDKSAISRENLSSQRARPGSLSDRGPHGSLSTNDGLTGSSRSTASTGHKQGGQGSSLEGRSERGSPPAVLTHVSAHTRANMHVASHMHSLLWMPTHVCLHVQTHMLAHTCVLTRRSSHTPVPLSALAP